MNIKEYNTAAGTASDILIPIDDVYFCLLYTSVRRLKEMGCTKDMVAMQGIGYKEMLSYLDGGYSLEEAVYIIKRETRHLSLIHI